MPKRRITRYNDTVGPELSSGMIVLTIFLAAVIILCVYFACNAEPERKPSDDTAGETAGDTSGDTAADPDDTAADAKMAEDTEPPEEKYDFVTVSSEESGVGFLILVNSTHPIANGYEEDIVTLYKNEEKSANYGLATASISCAHSILPYINEMVDAYFRDTDDGKSVINSGHRTVADQQSVWDSYLEEYGEEYTVAYVAVPGQSEHHTGYAIDISSHGDNANDRWMPENSYKYGFIRRYPDGKEDITGISFEYWHYRYVGTPHAEIITASGLCMEEYIELIGQYTFESPFEYTTEDEGAYMIYTYPASDGNETVIPVAKGYEYDISGNNAGGFIVTVTVTAPKVTE